MVKLFMLPADEGDFLWLSYGENHFSHILIDGGLEFSGCDYAKIINQIYECGESIEALILTHIDIDHIQGAIKGISEVSSNILKKVVKHIYFNTCRGILREQNKKAFLKKYGEDEITVTKVQKGYGVGEAITLLELLDEKEILDSLDDYIVLGRKICLNGGAALKIISPGEKQLGELAEKWENYEKKKEQTGYSCNFEDTRNDIDELKKNKLSYDSSVNNASSIAFLFEFENVKIAFLADALPSVCLKGLQKFGMEQFCKVDMVKLAHHGSKSNTSDKLLEVLSTNHYLLSTNGHGASVPSKVLLAHILKNAGKCKKGTIHLLCNYDWWDIAYHGNYFTDRDNNDYILSKKMILTELDEAGMKIKDGLMVYGEQN